MPMNVRRSTRTRRAPSRFDPCSTRITSRISVSNEIPDGVVTRSMSKCIINNTQKLFNKKVISSNSKGTIGYSNNHYNNIVSESESTNTYDNTMNKLEYLATIATGILENSINLNDPIDSHILYYQSQDIPVKKMSSNRLIFLDEDMKHEGYSDSQLKMITAGDDHDKWLDAVQENISKWKKENGFTS